MKQYSKDDMELLDEMQVYQYCLDNHHPNKTWEVDQIIETMGRRVKQIPRTSPVYRDYLNVLNYAKAKKRYYLDVYKHL